MRQYLERNICQVLDLIEGKELEPSDLSGWVKATVLPHLWGRGLIDARIEDSRYFFGLLSSRRHILILTPYGKSELTKYRAEEAAAMQALDVEWRQEI